LVEEGWVDHPVTTQIVRIYLSELFEEARQAKRDPDTLVLGCTHYPLLRSTIEAAVPLGLRVIDSAEAIAERVACVLKKENLIAGAGACESGGRHFFATDSVLKFQKLGARFLGEQIREVELVDLGG
jgi:glutamate racemase